MKIVNRYILKNFLTNFLIYFFIITALFYLNYIYQIINPILKHKPEISIILKIFFLLFPSVITLSLPTTFLLSAIITFSSLNENNEIIILQTIGIKNFFYTKNVLFISFVFFLFLLYFNTNLVPNSYKKFKKFYYDYVLSKPYIKFYDNSIINIEDKKIFVNKVIDNKLQGVFILNLEDKDILQTIYAKNAITYSDIYDNLIFELNKGKITNINKKEPNSIVQIKFEKYNFVIYNFHLYDIIQNNKTFREMTNKEIKNEIYKTKSDKYKRLLLSEYFLRYTLASSVIIFTLIGLILSFKIKKNSKPLSFVFSFFIILFYYFFILTSISIVENTTVSDSFTKTFFIMQIPNLSFLLIYLILILIFRFSEL